MQNFERCFHIRFIFQIKWSEKFNEINWNYVSGNKNQTWTFSQYFMGFSCWMSLIRFKHIEPYWFWTSQQTWQFSSLLFDTCLKNDFDIVFNFEIHLHIFHLKTLTFLSQIWLCSYQTFSLSQFFGIYCFEKR